MTWLYKCIKDIGKFHKGDLVVANNSNIDEQLKAARAFDKVTLMDRYLDKTETYISSRLMDNFEMVKTLSDVSDKCSSADICINHELRTCVGCMRWCQEFFRDAYEFNEALIRLRTKHNYNTRIGD